MQEGGKAIVCSEVVRLDGPAAGDGLASMAASLLLPDLPVFLLWRAPPDFERPVFRALRTLATRLVTDSTRFPETLDALGALIAQDREVVTDLAWTKITGWREVVASIFDDPDHRDALVRARARRDRLRARLRRPGAAAGRLAGGQHRLRRGRHDQAGRPRRHARRLAHARRSIDCGGQRYTVDRPQEGMAVIDAPGRATRRVALRVPPIAGPDRRGARVPHQRPRFSRRPGRDRGARGLSSDHARDDAFRGVPHARARDPGGCRPVHGARAADGRAGRRERRRRSCTACSRPTTTATGRTGTSSRSTTATSGRCRPTTPTPTTG